MKSMKSMKDMKDMKLWIIEIENILTADYAENAEKYKEMSL